MHVVLCQVSIKSILSRSFEKKICVNDVDYREVKVEADVARGPYVASSALNSLVHISARSQQLKLHLGQR